REFRWKERLDRVRSTYQKVIEEKTHRRGHRGRRGTPPLRSSASSAVNVEGYLSTGSGLMTMISELTFPCRSATWTCKRILLPAGAFSSTSRTSLAEVTAF